MRDGVSRPRAAAREAWERPTGRHSTPCRSPSACRYTTTSTGGSATASVCLRRRAPDLDPFAFPVSVALHPLLRARQADWSPCGPPPRWPNAAGDGSRSPCRPALPAPRPEGGPDRRRPLRSPRLPLRRRRPLRAAAPAHPGPAFRGPGRPGAGERLSRVRSLAVRVSQPRCGSVTVAYRLWSGPTVCCRPSPRYLCPICRNLQKSLQTRPCDRRLPGQTVCSPHTRGWPLRPDHGEPVHPLLPAHAGMALSP